MLEYFKWVLGDSGAQWALSNASIVPIAETLFKPRGSQMLLVSYGQQYD
jgi:hypothetical protein